MEESIREFGGRLGSADIRLFYYAGHGIQLQGRNYLIPVDANIATEHEVRYEGVDAARVLDGMGAAPGGVNILILDACRNNPFARSFRSGSRGLVRMDAPSGTVVVYATSPGDVAADGDGRNGVFTKHLLKVLDSSGLTLEQVFKRTGKSVVRETRGSQEPWISLSLYDDIYLAGSGGNAPTVVASASVPPPPTIRSRPVETRPAPFSVPHPDLSGKTLMLATTTFLANSGLMEKLIVPLFKKDTGANIKYVAVSSRKTLSLGNDCAVDAVLLPSTELAKQQAGAGNYKGRREILYSDFILVGPPSDPAGIRGRSVAEALKRISENRALFFSRADMSGTNAREIFLWKSAGLSVPSKASWYRQTGQGMVATLKLAGQKSGYALSDRATYIKMQNMSGGKLPLVPLVEGDSQLFVRFFILAVDPGRCSRTQYPISKAFSDWLASPSTQQAIMNFRLLGQPLFFPGVG